MKKIVCFNKVLKDTLPAEKVVSPDGLHWIDAVMRNNTTHTYEDQFYIFSYAL